MVAVTSQPAPERIPADHVKRCRRDHTLPDGWKRVDIALAFITGTTITLDVRTTNTQSASAARSPAAHLRVHENAKIVMYADYYRAFKQHLEAAPTSCWPASALPWETLRRCASIASPSAKNTAYARGFARMYATVFRLTAA